MAAWAVPINGFLDHTFIICDDVHFGCWGTSNPKEKNAKKILTGTGEHLLRVIKQYGGLFDSGNIGIYGIHGVCHQSTNVFLFATNNTWYMPMGSGQEECI